MRYTVRFANIVKGWEPTKRTVFAGDSDFRNWYDSSRESAAMVLDTDSEPNQVISLVSCSYNFWKQNERTVVTTSIDQNRRKRKLFRPNPVRLALVPNKDRFQSVRTHATNLPPRPRRFDSVGSFFLEHVGKAAAIV